MDNLTFQIVEVAIKAVVAFLVAYVIPVAKRWIDNVLATKWAKTAVQAAQQLQDIRKMDNPAKKSYAVGELSKILGRLKITMTDDQIEMLIESAVKQMKIEQEKQEITIDTEITEGE